MQSPTGSGTLVDVSTGFLPSGPARRTVSVCQASSCVDETSLRAMNGFCAVVGTPLIGFGLAGLPTYAGRVVSGPGAIGVAALAPEAIASAPRSTPAVAIERCIIPPWIIYVE